MTGRYFVIFAGKSLLLFGRSESEREWTGGGGGLNKIR